MRARDAGPNAAPAGAGRGQEGRTADLDSLGAARAMARALDDAAPVAGALSGPASVLWARFLRYDAADPGWPDRDRFLVSAAEGGRLLHALLRLTGQAGEGEAPGFGGHAGVEAAPGPPGFGFATAVGMALAERMMAARFGRSLVDHRTWVVAGAGELATGISLEAACLAGELRLERLTVLCELGGPGRAAAAGRGGSGDGSGGGRSGGGWAGEGWGGEARGGEAWGGEGRGGEGDEVLRRFAALGWAVRRVAAGDEAGLSAALSAALRGRRPALIACEAAGRRAGGGTGVVGVGAAEVDTVGAGQGGARDGTGGPTGGGGAGGRAVGSGDGEDAAALEAQAAGLWREAGRRGAAARRAWLKRLTRHQRRGEFERVLAGRLPVGWQSALAVLRQGPGGTAGLVAAGAGEAGVGEAGVGGAGVGGAGVGGAGLGEVGPAGAGLGEAGPGGAGPRGAGRGVGQGAMPSGSDAGSEAWRNGSDGVPGGFADEGAGIAEGGMAWAVADAGAGPGWQPAGAMGLEDAAAAPAGWADGAEAGGRVLEALAASVPELLGGVSGGRGGHATVAGGPRVSAGAYGGRHVHWGGRELGMAAALNGVALHGGLIPSVQAPFAAGDVMRPALQLAARMRRRVIAVLTQDDAASSHLPAGNLASLRAVPGLHVLRPADPEEVAECCALALRRHDGPSLLVLSRLAGRPRGGAGREPRPAGAHSDDGWEGRRGLCRRGGYVLDEPGGPRHATLIASGAEVAVALEAQAALEAAGLNVAVASLPCWELFAQQEEGYRAGVLGTAPRFGIEAAQGFGWERWLGEDGVFVGPEDSVGPVERPTPARVEAAVRRRLGLGGAR